MNLGTADIIRADSRHLPLADNSVDLVVTSPPYFALRSYQDGGEHYDGQIGAEPTPDEFVSSLLEVTAECVRVLKPSGSLWVNLGDKYAGNQGPQGAAGQRADRSQAATYTRRPQVPGMKSKSLIGIPWRYALRCIDELGLILRAEVIWSKPNGLPESVTDRVRRSHEQWFHFTMQPRYFSAVDEIREPHIYALPQRRNGPGGRPNDEAGRPAADGSQHLDGHPLGKLPGSVWTVPTEPLRVPDHLGVDHFAAFPTEWPKRIIRGWSPTGVCVACGDGLRPIATKEGGRPVARAHRHLPGYSDPAGEGMRDMTYRIEGYECTCRTWTPSDIASARTAAPTTATTPTTPPTSAAAAGSLPTSTPDATANARSVESETTSTTGARSASTLPALRPAVVLDPFGGTGTTAMVAKALGRHGISVDMSADYCRLAEWRTNDRDQLAKVLGVAKVEKPSPDEVPLFDLGGGAA